MHYIFEKPYALWPFGSGRSYSEFTYSGGELHLEGDTVVASVTVNNVSLRDGKEVVQLYVSDPVSSILTPVRQLKAFEKVEIPAGESREVILRVPVEELEFDNGDGRRAIEHGEFIFSIGPSSDSTAFSQTLRL